MPAVKDSPAASALVSGRLVGDTDVEATSTRGGELSPMVRQQV